MKTISPPTTFGRVFIEGTRVPWKPYHFIARLRQIESWGYTTKGAIADVCEAIGLKREHPIKEVFWQRNGNDNVFTDVISIITGESIGTLYHE